MNSRRAVIAGAALFSVLGLSPGYAEQTTSLIAFLSGTRLTKGEIDAIKQGLVRAGYTEGRNVAIEYRSAEGQYDRLPALTADLVNQSPRVIVAVGGTVTALAAKRATSTIPIVFATAGDPVKLGLVSSLNRPGANVTGATFLASGLAAKRLQLLKQMVPAAMSVGFIANPANPNFASETREMQEAARRLGMQIREEHASDEQQINVAFSRFVAERVSAVIVAADAIFSSRRGQLVALAIRDRLPTIYPLPEYVAAGGLVSYGASRVEAFQLVGAYAGRILKGEKPSELPVQQSQKLELVINLVTAKALGITLPKELLLRADEVLE